MEQFKQVNRLKGLLQRADMKELNAVYCGICVGVINSTTDIKDERESIISNNYFKLNELATLDRDVFNGMMKKLYEIKDNVLMLPKFYVHKKDPKIEELTGLDDSLGGIVGNVNDNIQLFQKAIDFVMHSNLGKGSDDAEVTKSI